VLARERERERDREKRATYLNRCDDKTAENLFYAHTFANYFSFSIFSIASTAVALCVERKSHMKIISNNDNCANVAVR
jgi:hypothetical protein